MKGFTMDDERLKNPPGKGQKDYFEEQLERVRDIRSLDRHPKAGHAFEQAVSGEVSPNEAGK